MEEAHGREMQHRHLPRVATGIGEVPPHAAIAVEHEPGDRLAVASQRRSEAHLARRMADEVEHSAVGVRVVDVAAARRKNGHRVVEEVLEDSRRSNEQAVHHAEYRGVVFTSDRDSREVSGLELGSS